LKSDSLEYREEQPLTGDESRVAEVSDIDFPTLLDPVDDLPPATAITWPRPGVAVTATDGTLVVRGTTTDNGETEQVLVNGVPARNVDYGFHSWEATLENVKPGPLRIEARARDAAGNEELTPHAIEIVVQ
jgi:hypothetical protein